MPPPHRLRDITNAILSPELHYGKLRQACNDLYDLFKELTAFEENESDNSEDIYFDSGMAVGSSSAAFCLIDFWRTRSFMMGIHKAIEEQRKIQVERPVTILYAGTGPFATLALPFCSIYGPSEIQLVLLELNPQSFQYLQKLVEQTGVSSYVKHMELTDVCTWKVPDGIQPDILISETMKKGLQKEPQVSVFAALVPQCKKELILIPEQITVSAALIGKPQTDPPEVKVLGTLFELTDKSARAIHQDKLIIPVFDKGVEIFVPESDVQYKTLILHTSIRIYKDILLDFMTCSITLPHKLVFDISRIPCRLLFHYDLGSKPGFRFTYL